MKSLKQIVQDVFKFKITAQDQFQCLKDIHKLTPRPLIMKYIESHEAAKSEGYEEIGTVYWDHMEEPYHEESTAIYLASKYFHVPENLVIEFLDIRFCRAFPNQDLSMVLARRIS